MYIANHIQQDLDRQADQIERAFASELIPVKVEGGHVGTDWIQYRLAPLAHTESNRMREAAARVADAIGTHEIRIEEDDQGLALEVFRVSEDSLRLLSLLDNLPQLSDLKAVLGVSSHGRPVILNLRKISTWNFVVRGGSATGKSELLRTIMLSLALTSRQAHLQMLGIDLSGRELTVLESLPHSLSEVATDPGYGYSLLEWLVDEIERRKAYQISSPNIVMFIDDADTLMDKDPRLAEKIGSALNYILSHGLSAGVHLVFSSTLELTSLNTELLHLTSARPKLDAQGAGDSTGLFRIQVGKDVIDTQAASLLLQDLNSAVELVNSGWRAGTHRAIPPIFADSRSEE
jgi:DNA segregation ATPase FtsK/SpoIIIE-like protein